MDQGHQHGFRYHLKLPTPTWFSWQHTTQTSTRSLVATLIMGINMGPCCSTDRGDLLRMSNPENECFFILDILSQGHHVDGHCVPGLTMCEPSLLHTTLTLYWQQNDPPFTIGTLPHLPQPSLQFCLAPVCTISLFCYLSHDSITCLSIELVLQEAMEGGKNTIFFSFV